MIKASLLKLILIFLCISFLVGCSTPVNIFTPRAITEKDSEQGNCLFIKRQDIRLTLCLSYKKDAFIAYLNHLPDATDNYIGNEVKIDCSKMKIIDELGEKYLPNAIYVINNPNYKTLEGGTKKNTNDSFTLQNLSDLRVEFPLSVLKLMSFQLNLGITGDKSLEVFSVKQHKGWGFTGGETG